MIKSHFMLIITCFMIKGLTQKSHTNQVIHMSLNAPLLSHKNNSKKYHNNLKLLVWKSILLNHSVKAKKYHLTLTFIHSIHRKKLLFNINKIKYFWLMFGPHGVGLAKNLWTTIKKCCKKINNYGKIKSELLQSVLIKKKIS